MGTVIPIVTGVITSVLAAVILSVITKNQKEAEIKEKEREERENLTLESLDATFSICKELTRCVRGEKPNGELTEAFDYMQDVKHRIAEYQRKRASRQ